MGPRHPFNLIGLPFGYFTLLLKSPLNIKVLYIITLTDPINFQLILKTFHFKKHSIPDRKSQDDFEELSLYF